MPATFSTFIRRAERDDLDIVISWMEDPDFGRFLYGDPARSPRQVREQIVSMLGRASGHTMPGGIYLVIDSKEHGPVGLLSLQNISWRNRCCSIDLYIGQKFLRNATVAAFSTFRAVEYCFDELNLHRVQAYIYSFNSPSWRLFERAGAKRELVLREHVARDSQLYDVYGFGLLREEFNAFRSYVARMRGATLQDMVRAMAGEGDSTQGEHG